jgi:integrative and conjugative element protein (TIGR02256 family)
MLFNSEDLYFEISENIIPTLDKYRQNLISSNESGGILIGRKIIDKNEFIVERISEPNSNDKKSRFSFFRAKNPSQEIINNTWSETEGALNYLGECHTHPESIPDYSIIDKKNWIKISKISKQNFPYLFFIIVGIVEISVWSIEIKNYEDLIFLQRKV